MGFNSGFKGLMKTEFSQLAKKPSALDNP